MVRQAGGTLKLRIDDADADRTQPGYIEDIFRQLDWLGITWDEGPAGPGRLSSPSLPAPAYRPLLGRVGPTCRHGLALPLHLLAQGNPGAFNQRPLPWHLPGATRATRRRTRHPHRRTGGDDGTGGRRRRGLGSAHGRFRALAAGQPARLPTGQPGGRPRRPDHLHRPGHGSPPRIRAHQRKSPDFSGLSVHRRAKPDYALVPGPGIEPGTLGFSVRCSTS